MIDTSRTLAELVLEVPARAVALERLGLDYCCGGTRTLADACALSGTDEAAAAAALEAAAGTASAEEIDWTQAPLGELCDHIVADHHDRMREELPRLSELLSRVERVHGDGRPQLAELRETFEELRAELAEHMDDEEARLFPICRSGEKVTDDEVVAALTHEHEETGAALERLRWLADGYDLEMALCNTHRTTLYGLHELERDLHRHIHEENNILFPRALAAG